MADDLVLTPGGYRPRSMVHGLAAGSVLDGSNGRLRSMTSSGAVAADFGELAIRPGNEPLHPANVHIPAEKKVPAFGSGWITFASWTDNTGKPITSFKTSWSVPAAPSTQSGQLLFLFNGIQNSTMIYQPVLQWGVSAAGGGNYWSIATWYVDGQGGPAFHSPLTQVSPGTVLQGVMTLTGQSGAKFSYSGSFVGFPNSGYNIQNVEQLTWLIQTLECYGITKCSDYPASPRTAMTAIDVRNASGEVNPTWAVTNTVTDCNQHTLVVSDTSPSGEVDIYYMTDSEQAGWRWCHKCQGMFFGDNASKGVCPADHKAHDPSQSGLYASLFGENGAGQQGSWRWCHKCQGMFFSGNASQGVCPADHKAHDPSQSGHYAELFGENGAGQQGGWRWCHKCQGLFFALNPSHGFCPADGQPHDPSQSGHYAAIFTEVS